MKSPNIIFLVWRLAAVLGATALAAARPHVDLGYVKYVGYNNATSGINYFRGIPYAQPPLGSLRWQNPRPIEENNDFNGRTYDATTAAQMCYQSLPLPLISMLAQFVSVHDGIPVGNQSEDCLVLDVLAPENPVSKELPVIVGIHGGGYTVGSAADAPGDAIVHASKGKVIYVSIQYRLGLFGFLAGSEVMSNGRANAGLLDQRAALDWVQRHIARFGGDPSRVTIWGGSAGGGSVTYQLIAGGAVDNPPFRQAIAEYPWWQPLMNSSSQERQYANVLKTANCTDLACLRSLPPGQLQEVNGRAMNNSYKNPGYGYGVFNYGPVVDGRFIRDLPDQEFKKGNFYRVPTIVDHDAYEGVMFSNASLSSQTEETADALVLFPSAGPAFLRRLYQLYPSSSYNSTFFQRQAWFGDFIINCPTYYMASAMANQNYNSSAVFKLVFAAGTELHAATLPFLMSNDINSPGSNNNTLTEIMTDYWISFAVTGDPNPLRSEKAAFWPSYMSGEERNGEGAGFDVLSVTYTSVGAEQDPDASPQCDFFGAQGYVVSN